MLILEIFGARAQSHEGKLQVELARLQYLSTRLVRRWSHLERQRGGIGTRGGPGEAQIELDRRMIGERIKALKEQLEQGQAPAQHAARARASAAAPSASRWSATPTPASRRCSMRWSRPRAYAADQLFATLDTTTRQLYLDGRAAARRRLSDTVGFIRDLPHKLVEAFQATLQEAADADLLLHVVDAASPQRRRADRRGRARAGRDRRRPTCRRSLVFNKLDRLDETAAAARAAPTASSCRPGAACRASSSAR